MLYINVKKELESFNLEVELEAENGRIGLLGESGSGKSMTLKMIAGIEKPDEGLIILNNRVLFDSKKKINLPARERNVGYLFQNYALFPQMNVMQNIVSGMRKSTKAEKQQEAERRIKQLKLEGLETRYPRQLSGGQQQRVAIGRMLVANPEILMFDEPFSALDYHLREHMQEQFLEILEDLDKTSLLVSHDIDEAYRLCHKIAVVNKGKIDAFDTKENIFENPQKLSAALITGCKNISRVKKISSTSVQALDWGITLTIPPTQEEITHIGIRAHHLKFVSQKETNCFTYQINNMSETRFNQTLMLNLSQNQTTTISHLRLDMPKELWHKAAPMPYIYLPPSKLLLLK